MKALLMTLMLTSLNTMALDLNERALQCESKVARFYEYNGSRSDRPKEIRSGEVLLAGNPLLNTHGNVVTTFDADKIVYEGHGSYYSGYFIDAIIVNPSNCKVEKIYNIYGE